jgi:multidrug resistance efflux pump
MGFDFNNKKRLNIEEKKVEYAPVKRHLAKWQWYLLVLIILSPLIYFVSAILIDSLIVTASGYVYYDKILVRAPENGYINNVLVKEGEHVKLNKRLINMRSPRLSQELKHLQEELERLKDIKLNIKNPEIEHFIIMKNNLQKHLYTTIEYVKTINNLRNKKLATISDQQKARTDFKNIELEIKDIDRAMARSNLYHTFKLEEQYGQIIRELETGIIKLEASIELMNIPSPGDGAVAKIFTRRNEYVSKGQNLMDITTQENLRIIAYLDYKHMSDEIYQGKTVTVMLPDNVKISGKIAQIPSLAEHQNKFTSIIKTEKNKILLIITLTEKLPPKYRIYGLPVKVVLKDYGLSFFIK